MPPPISLQAPLPKRSIKDRVERDDTRRSLLSEVQEAILCSAIAHDDGDLNFRVLREESPPHCRCVLPSARGDF